MLLLLYTRTVYRVYHLFKRSLVRSETPLQVLHLLVLFQVSHHLIVVVRNVHHQTTEWTIAVRHRHSLDGALLVGVTLVHNLVIVRIIKD